MNVAREVFKGITYTVEGAIERRLGNAADSSASHSTEVTKLNAIVQDLRTELGNPLSYRILYLD